MHTVDGAEQYDLAPSGARTVIGPLMWGQRAIWTGLRWRGAEDHLYNQPTTRRLSAPATPEEVRAALLELIRRHETLRTVYDLDPEHPSQQVLDRIELPVDVRPLDGEAAVKKSTSADVAPTDVPPPLPLDDLTAQRFDYRAELPLRARLFTRGDRVEAVGLVAHHLAVDGWSLHLVSRQLGELVAGRAPEEPAALAETMQPYDRMLFEQSARGRRLEARTLAHWEEHIREADPVMIAELPGPLPAPETVTLESAGLAHDVRTVTARTGAGETAVLLTAAGALLAVLTGAAHPLVRVITAPRFRPGTRYLIGAFNQNSLLSVASGDLPPEAHLSATTRALLTAYRHCECDPLAQDRLIVAAGAKRGITTGGFCFFNDIRFESAYRPDLRPAGQDPGKDPGPPRLTRGSAPANYGSVFFLTLERFQRTARITLSKDPRFLADCDTARFLTALAHVVRLTASPEIDRFRTTADLAAAALSTA